MQQSILTWNIPNFVSVSLMVLLLAALMLYAGKALKTAQQG